MSTVNAELIPGCWSITFVAGRFRNRGVLLPETPFLVSSGGRAHERHRGQALI
ncbi:uncharacterized protein TrAFT101_002386 [Trichoderma asperellum]|uniref:uncharacterized protein n=1 Tax=Trichoderma asperellum TaxID=101201 RepID=UPI0033267685|nr:hypothetical protein TrAFT101_002386 [Trichoderma asperellum]